MSDIFSDDPGFIFTQRPGGLFVPAAVRVGKTTFRYPTAADDIERLLPRRLRSFGVMPGHSDLYPAPAPGLASFFAAAPTEWWLAGLTSLAASLAMETIAPDDVQGFLRQTILSSQQQQAFSVLESLPGGPRKFKTLDDFPVLISIELAAAMSTPSSARPQSEGLADRDIVRAVYCVWDKLNEALGDVREAPSGVAASLYERSSLGSIVSHLQTAFGCWVWEHPFVQEQERQIRGTFDAAIRSEYSVGIRDWVAALTVPCFSLLLQPFEGILRTPQLLEYPRQDLTREGNTVVAGVVGALATDLQDFARECRELNTKSPLAERPTLLPLKRHPCLKVHTNPDRFHVLSPVHLAEAAFERPVRLAETLHPDRTRETRGYFGQLIEAYIHGLFNEIFGDRYQRLRLGGRADGILWYPDGCIVVECKATRVREMIRYTSREDDAYLDELKTGLLPKAVKQIKATARDVLSGAIERRGCKKLDTLAAMIVFFQEIPPTHIAAPVLEKLLPPTEVCDGALLLRPQVISVEGVEELDRWSHLNLLDVLRKKMQGEDSALESLRNYLFFEGFEPQRPRFRAWCGQQMISETSRWLLA